MDDLISEFITETVESLSVLDSELVQLEQDPGNAAILGKIFRIMHTIKGTCGFLGLPRLESLAHACEDILGKIRDKKLDASPQAVTLILESLDHIKSLVGHLSQTGEEQEGDDSELVERLNNFSDSDGADNEFPYFKGDDEPVIEKKPKSKIDTEAEKTSTGTLHSIRVNIDVLENFMQAVSELVLTRNQLMQMARAREEKEFMPPLQQLSHITTELQEGVMKTRMQPIGNAWSKFPRMVRDLSHELGKRIELKQVGVETELDRQQLEAIKDPLTHMVRNSCDHGLETPQERLAAGKPETGTLMLSAHHEGGHIVIEIADDGRGIPVDKIKKKALDKGLASAAQLEAMNDKHVMQFIFAAGFSTAEKVTSLSGRGVGMDVVLANVQKIGGTIDLDSARGKGSKVRIKIPLTLAIVSVLIVEAQGQKFAIPQNNVMEMVRIEAGDPALEAVNDALVLRLRDTLLPLAALNEVLGFPKDRDALLSRGMFIAVCKVGERDFGLVLDRVYDTEEIVIKPVSGLLKHIPLYAGNTILGDGSVIMILDPGELAAAIGNFDVAARGAKMVKASTTQIEPTIGFLLFTLGKGAPKAVPLELVTRLEKIDVARIEIAEDYPVVQYRGKLMRLTTLGKEISLPDKGTVAVIVFSYDNKLLGLVVNDIIDIVQTPLAIQISSKDSREHGYLGSMVIGGKTTDIVDVTHLLADLMDAEDPNVNDISKAKAEQCNILLVEDNPFFRNLTAPMLASVGYKITVAESAADALSILRKSNTRFDMIITDIEMPGMSGFELALACRSEAELSGIPIVAYTALMGDEMIRRSKQAGISDCIMKTDRPGLLQAIAHHTAKGRKGWVAA